MSNNAPDYENNLAFDPDIKTMPRCDIEELKAENKRLAEKVEGLETELYEVLSILLRVSPQHDEWIRLNFPDFYKKQANVWFE